jgi:hypothetical protein
LVDGRDRRQRMNQIPQRIWKQRGGHTRFTLPRRRGQASEVLLDALRISDSQAGDSSSGAG